MATGKTHDGVTVLLLIPIFAACRWWIGMELYPALLITVGTAVGGLLLSPDLDTRSRPFYRWGLFRFIWWPYQWMLHHRSPLSHGLFLGPLFRTLYVTAVLILLYFGLFALLRSDVPLWHARQDVLAFLNRHLNDLLLLTVGIWLGSLAHVVLDVLSDRLPARRRRASRR